MDDLRAQLIEIDTVILALVRPTLARRAFVLSAIVACSPSGREASGTRPAAGPARPFPATAATANADSVARARQDAIDRARPGYIVDSILPPDEALRRFTERLPRPATLANGAPSRDALVRRWVRAVERNDSLTLIRSAVNRGEFAYLIYPRSSLAHPPTYQPPDLAWLQLSNGSVQGFRRILQRHGGRSMGFAGYDCPRPAEREGDLTLWRGCLVQIAADGSVRRAALFGSIVERGGVFKFLSLANDL
ncbi:MAG TPA: hypothetical protein VFV33_25065 [Gemmatimonadaceae bacterium]|nr:hypothetical protein [Gemmatimonadaceae bacterium]